MRKEHTTVSGEKILDQSPMDHTSISPSRSAPRASEYSSTQMSVKYAGIAQGGWSTSFRPGTHRKFTSGFAIAPPNLSGDFILDVGPTNLSPKFRSAPLPGKEHTAAVAEASIRRNGYDGRSFF
jgi:hypothetical protein